MRQDKNDCARKKRLLSDKLFFTEPSKYLGDRILNQTNYLCFLDTNKPEKIVTSLLFTMLDLKVAYLNCPLSMVTRIKKISTFIYEYFVMKLEIPPAGSLASI